MASAAALLLAFQLMLAAFGAVRGDLLIQPYVFCVSAIEAVGIGGLRQREYECEWSGVGDRTSCALRNQAPVSLSRRPVSLDACPSHPLGCCGPLTLHRVCAKHGRRAQRRRRRGRGPPVSANAASGALFLSLPFSFPYLLHFLLANNSKRFTRSSAATTRTRSAPLQPRSPAVAASARAPRHPATPSPMRSTAV